MNKNVKKVLSVVAVGAIALGAAGCSQTYDQEQVSKMVSEASQKAYIEGAKSVDVKVDNEAVTKIAVEEATKNLVSPVEMQAKIDAQKAADDKVLADMRADLDAAKAELAQLTITVKDSEPVVVTKEEVSSYVKDELALNSAVADFSLDDSDIASFQDTKIKFDDEDTYDIHEELNFNDVSVKTSVYDNDFSEKVYLTLEAENAIEYKYVFDDTINMSLITKDEPLYIKFLGKDLEIVDVTSNSFTTIEGEKLMMTEGESKIIKVDGKDVKVDLKVVSDSNNKISVAIDGVTESGIAEGDVVEVGNYEVYVKSVMANEAGDVTGDIVELRIAKDVEKEYQHGDQVIDGDDRFLYTVYTSAGKLTALGVSYAEISNDLSDDYLPLTVGDKLTFPNDFLTISLGLKDVNYDEFKFSFADKDGQDVLKIDASDNEGIQIGTEKLNKAYINATHVFYEDDNGDDKIVALSGLKLVNEDVDYTVTYTSPVVSVGAVNITTNGGFDFLGTTEDQDEATEIVYNGGNFGSQEESVVLADGTIIKTPESNGNSDRVVMKIPSEVVEAEILVN